ncbi:hypothetical protein P7C70_g2361, partial [Phenoliferia sp. Uapishka_3]
MPTISDLPTECLLHILELIDDSRSSRSYQYRSVEDILCKMSHSQAMATLASASLVCHAWQNLAQSIMWSRLLVGHRTYTYFIVSPAFRRYGTVELVLCTDDGLISGEVQEIIDLFEGLRILRVTCVRESCAMQGTCLEFSSLRDLVELDLNTPLHHPTTGVLRTSFQLSTLTVGRYVTSLPVIKAIFGSSSHTLTSLTIRVSPSIQNSIAGCISILSETLETLRILFYEDCPEDLPDHIASFKKLTHVNLLANHRNVPSFDKLVFSLPSVVTTKEIRVLLPSGHVSFQTLEERVTRKNWWKSIVLTRSGLEQSGKTGAARLIALCAAKNVALLFKFQTSTY